jgi:carbon-monoxide dehydrogenase small subunit
MGCAEQAAIAEEAVAEKQAVTLTINGEPYELDVRPNSVLLDTLRYDLGLTGSKEGCSIGVCGACTVLVDGKMVSSCLMLTVMADGAEITTIEGITPPKGLNRMQQAFKDHHGLQCGFCTAGILMTLEGVDPGDYPDERSIRELLAGNLCRCTGYQNIVAAVMDAWGTKGS